jgi:hypothetical protein
MKTSLLVLVSATALVAFSSAAAFGLALPAALDAGTVFSGFVVALMLGIALADYAPRRRSTPARASTPPLAVARTARAEHPLAA